MNRKIMRTSALSALALTLVLWGCESLSESALVGPGERSDVLLTTTDKDGYTVARETDPSVGVVSAVIDQNGGALNIGKHSLTVPAGAVDGPTTFTMTKLEDDIEVGLTATRLLLNDVGRQGFAVPVRLSLSYANAAEVPENVEALKVVWVKATGELVAQASAVDASGKRVTGSLSHFSQYALAEPNADDALGF